MLQWKQLRFLMLLIAGLAFLGGTTVQALPPSSMALAMTATSHMPDCAEMAAMLQDTGKVPASPHHGITPDCVKLTQCLGVPDLPARAQLALAQVTYIAISHWYPNRRLMGLSPTPVPFPPRSA